jgi:hypothetical protein
MRRSMLLVVLALVMAAMLLVGVGAAFAEPPSVEFRDGPANPNANCIGTASSDATHNGQHTTLGQGGDPSHGTRGEEIKAAHATPGC